MSSTRAETAAPPAPAVTRRVNGLTTWLLVASLIGSAVALGVVLPQGWAENLPASQKAAAPAPQAAAKNKLAYTPPAWPEPPDSGRMLLRLGLGTAVVLGLCVVTLWVGKRWLRGVPSRQAGGGRLHLVETLPLGNRCCVHLLRAGRQQVLVGVDVTGLKALVALPESFDETLGAAVGGAGPASSELLEDRP